MNENDLTGEIINKTKHIEYLLNCIVSNYIATKREGFFSNIILNSTVISLGQKIQIIEVILKLNDIPFNFNDARRLISLRNLFAHESAYADDPKGITELFIDSLKNGQYKTKRFEDLHSEFITLYPIVDDTITSLNQKLSSMSLK